ncbi:MAG: ribonuclease III [Clostridia bacterium]|nr:ribonuclease III [Clostridia bacterium]
MGIKELEKTIGYNFKDKKYVETALTHSSYANERQMSLFNERLEFLGDSVLGFITAEYFFNNFNHLPEGQMTKLRAATVCEKALHSYALTIKLGDSLLLGRGEELTGGRTRASILADAFEALIAAIYLDGGMEKARDFVLPFIQKAAHEIPVISDYKTALQEIIQKNRDEHISYVLVGESGPDHNKQFEVEVRLNSNVIGLGVGKSKKTAEQQAAKKALELMGVSV